MVSIFVLQSAKGTNLRKCRKRYTMKKEPPNKTPKRCWPGYEPVPGKKNDNEGSCRPKAPSELTQAEKAFRAARKRQLNKWQSEHPDSPRKAAQHLAAPKLRPSKRVAPVPGKTK